MSDRENSIRYKNLFLVDQSHHPVRQEGVFFRAVPVHWTAVKCLLHRPDHQRVQVLQAQAHRARQVHLQNRHRIHPVQAHLNWNLRYRQTFEIKENILQIKRSL